MFNPLVRVLTKAGISVKGSRVLVVPGRTTGEPRSTVVNLLTVDGVRYLVAPAGRDPVGPQPPRQRRPRRPCGSAAAAEQFAAIELTDDEKPPVLRAYLTAWAWEVGRFFDGLRADSPDADVAAAASDFPVFRLG